MALSPKESSAAPKFADAKKLEQALGNLRRLPLLPTTAHQAMALANEHSADLREFSNLVERDVTLASSILKLANSPFFNWGRTIESLEQAVLRLGFRECQNLILAVAMRNLFQNADPVSKGRCAVLWQHCLLTACLCRRLNQELKYDYHGEEFAAGLLHDLGRILLAVSAPDQFPAADPMDFMEEDGILDREREILDTNHCQVGTEYAQENRLPFSAIAAIRFHHHFRESPDHRGILGLVATADHMANYLQRRQKPDAYDASLNPGLAYLASGWTPEKKASLQKLLPHLMSETEKVANQKARLKKTGSSVSRPRPDDDETISQKSLWGNVRSWLGW